jgi:hypothetical protein
MVVDGGVILAVVVGLFQITKLVIKLLDVSIKILLVSMILVVTRMNCLDVLLPMVVVGKIRPSVYIVRMSILLTNVLLK